MRRGDIAHPAREHDRLVIAAHFALAVQLEGAEIAREVGTPELVVVGRAADGAVDHDRERGGDAVGLAVGNLPRLLRVRNGEVRDREAGEARLGLGARACRALVANLAARARARARMRRDRGRVVMRLDLHEDVREVAPIFPRAVASGEETLDLRAFHHRRIVGIRDERAVRIALVRVADHLEERLVLRLAVDLPGRVEDLVAAMLGVRLREHHQLDVGGIAAQAPEIVDEVVDLVGREREAHRGVGLLERLRAAVEDVDPCERLRRVVLEELLRLGHVRHHRLGHAVVDGAVERPARTVGKRAGIARGDVVGDAALDAHDLHEGAVVRDVGGLGRPGGNRPGTRDDQQQLTRVGVLAAVPTVRQDPF